MHNRERRVHVTLVYHPCAKFSRGQMYANMFESVCDELSMSSRTISCIGSSVTSKVEWSVDLLRHMHINFTLLC